MHSDIAIIYSEFLPSDNYHIYPLLKDELVLVINKNHPIADRKEVNLSEVSSETFIFLSDDPIFYNFCVNECIKSGFTPHIHHANVRLITIINYILKGLRASLLLKKWVDYLNEPNIRIVRLKDRPTLTLSIITRNEPFQMASISFVNYITTHLKGNSSIYDSSEYHTF